MNGTSLLVDTNIVLYLLGGDITIAEVLDGKHIYISEISELELLSYSKFDSNQLKEVESFLGEIVIIEMNETIKKEVIQLRRKHKVKLPDAIIASTAIYLNMPLLSADKGFEKIEELNFLKYELG